MVDDEPAVCDAIKMMLKFDGHAVQSAQGSKEALSLLEQGKFDLIITDYSMVGMKGDQLAAIIKERVFDRSGIRLEEEVRIIGEEKR